MENHTGQSNPQHFPVDPDSPVADEELSVDRTENKPNNKLLLVLFILIAMVTLLNAGLSVFIIFEKYL